MRDIDLAINWVGVLAENVRDEIADLSAEELAWQPDPGANGIGVTAWHFTRWLDVLATRAFADGSLEEELWFTRGWAERTGYDPRGIGYMGLGVLTGYSLQEAAAVPALSAAELLEYLEDACTTLQDRLRALPDDGFHQPVPGFGGKRSPYSWLSGILLGCFGHVGEIEALKNARARRLAQVG